MGRAFEVRKVAMAKTSAAKSKLYAKYGKEIYMAAKSGGPDPDTNINLKRLLDKAKKDQISSDTIKRAIDKAKGGSDENYTEVRYEGFGPSNSMFIIECLTDNVARTIAEVRNCFTKTGGKIGVTGSVVHQFKHQAVITVQDMSEDEVIEILITNDIDAQEIDAEENEVTIYGNSSDLYAIKTALQESKPDAEFATEEIMWLPITETSIDSEDDKVKFDKLISMLDELDDVQDYYHNVV